MPKCSLFNSSVPFRFSLGIPSHKTINKQTEEKLTEDLKLSNQEDNIFKLIYGTNSGPYDLDPLKGWDDASYDVIFLSNNPNTLGLARLFC